MIIEEMKKRAKNLNIKHVGYGKIYDPTRR